MAEAPPPSLPVSSPADPLALLRQTYDEQSKSSVAQAARALDLGEGESTEVLSERAPFIACCRQPVDVSALAGFLFDAGLYYGLSPALLWAIMIIESNGVPTAVNEAGPAYGLMQISLPAHRAWFASADWKDPKANIFEGASILRMNYSFFRSARESVRLPPGVQDPRPLTGFALTFAAIAAYNRDMRKVLRDIATGAGADAGTERVRGVGYANTVLRKAAELSQRLLARGSVLGNATNSLALVIAAPAATMATQVYQRAYDGLLAFRRSSEMAATSRTAFYAESAAARLRQAASASKDGTAASEAVPIYARPSPTFSNDENLVGASFDFTTGRWGGTGPMT